MPHWAHEVTFNITLKYFTNATCESSTLGASEQIGITLFIYYKAYNLTNNLTTIIFPSTQWICGLTYGSL